MSKPIEFVFWFYENLVKKGFKKKQAGAELCQAQLSLKLASHKGESSQFLIANSFGA